MAGTKASLCYAKFHINGSIFGDFWPRKTPKIKKIANLVADRANSLTFGEIYAVFAAFPSV